MCGFSSVWRYSLFSGMGAVGAKDLSSSFKASVNAAQSVLPPLPSMTSWEVSTWSSHSCLNDSRLLPIGAAPIGVFEAGAVGVGVGVGGMGFGVADIALRRLNRLLNISRNISSGLWPQR